MNLNLFFPKLQISSCALSFYKKLLAAHNYKPESKVKSNVTLIKPTENYAKLSTDYGLSEVNFDHFAFELLSVTDCVEILPL